MKKILFLVAIIGALVSCSENETSSISPDVSNNLIRFNTLRDKVVTRYANDNKSDYQVYALITDQTDWFIDNVIVPGASSSGNDSIQNGASYYWPGSNTDVDFYAYAPADSSTTSTGITAVDASAATPSINISYTVLSSADEDFTIAIPRKQYSGEVNLTFQHMLSKINVTAQLSSELIKGGYTISSGYTATLIVPYNTSTIDAVYTYDETTSPTPTWGTLSASETVSYSGDSTYIFMPQSYTATTSSTTGNCSIQLTGLTIKGAGNTDVFDGDLLVYDLQDGDITGNAFEMGKIYNVVFTITEAAKNEDGDNIFSDKITFTSTVSEWTTTTAVDITQP